MSTSDPEVSSISQQLRLLLLQYGTIELGGRERYSSTHKTRYHQRRELAALAILPIEEVVTSVRCTLTTLG